jgi:hypothetical protein
MKNLLTNLVGLALLLASPFFASQVVAQGTAGSGAVIRVTVNGAITDFSEGPCGYGTANWGGTVTSGLCGTPAWGYSAPNDSFGCSAIPANSLTGKFGMVRRGGVPTACGFSIKALNLQQAGAVAALIANHSLNASETDCHTQAIGATAPQSDQTTIPCFFMSRFMTNHIDNALKAGSTVEICLLLPEVTIPSYFFPALSKQTPVNQIATDTFGFGLNITNRVGVDLTDVELGVSVLDANNNVLYSATEVIPSLAATVVDSPFVIPGLYAPELPIGTYKLRYTTKPDLGATPAVPARSETNFYVTQRLFAKDDGATIGFRPGTIGDSWGIGAMYTLLAKNNLEKYKVNTIEFAFTTNAADLPVEDVVTDIYFFKVNDDVDFNVAGSFDNSAFISPSFEWLGIAPYEAPTGLAGFTLQQIQILDLLSGNPGIELENGSRYIVAAEYTGTSKNVFHAFDQDAALPAPSTLVFNSTWFTGGFQGGPSAVLRMYLDLVNTTDETPLAESTMQIRPNPIVETLNLQVAFDQATDATITIAEMSGRVILNETRTGLTNDMLSYQVPQLASGTYLARIATKQGTLTKKFIVQK